MPIGNAPWGDFTCDTEAEMAANASAVIGTTCLRTDSKYITGGQNGLLFALATLPSSVAANWNPVAPGGTTLAGNATMTLAQDNVGDIIEIGSATAVVTVPKGLEPGFACSFIPPTTGQVTLTPASGVLLNGGTASVIRTTANNKLFGLIGRVSALDSYIVGGA